MDILRNINTIYIILPLIICQYLVICKDNNGTEKLVLNLNETKIERKIIYKCHCLADEILVEGLCKPHKTMLDIFNSTITQSVSVSTLEFGEILVKNTTCGKGMYLKEIPSSLALLFENGHLYDAINVRVFTQEEFCVEHMQTQQRLSTVFQVCQEIPSVTQCCPHGYVLDLKQNCLLDENFIFQPPFADGTKLRNLPGNIQKINYCPAGLDIHWENISNPDLHYFLSLSDNDDAVLQKYPHGFEVGQKYNSSEFCIAATEISKNSYYYRAFYCKKNKDNEEEITCSKASCFRKCCPENHVFNEQYVICVHTNQNLSFPFTNKFAELDNTSKSTNILGHIIYGSPYCSDIMRVERSDHNVSLVLETGILHIDTLSQYTPNDYCVENVGHGIEYREVAFVCIEDENLQSNCSWRFPFVSSLLGISSVFLLATLVVYIGIKDLRSKTSGKCLISEVLSLLISYIALIVIQTAQDRLSTKGCRIAGIIEHVSILASFFWLNIMCVDVWLTIRSHRPVSDDSKSNKRFIFYSLFGWGSPLIIGVTAIVVDNAAINDELLSLLRPGIGQNSCFFADRLSQWAYLYSIVVVLLSINFVLFGHIVFILVKAQRNNNKVFRKEGKTAGGNKDPSRERFWMYLKLFIVMGVTWVAEVISFEVDHHYYSCYYWLPTDIVNALRGITIFIIFVCKKRTLNKIKAKLSFKKPEIARRMSSIRISRSNQTNTRTSNVSGLTYHPNIRTVSNDPHANVIKTTSF